VNDAVNEAVNFGAVLKPIAAPTGKECWRVVKVRRLTANENRGKHNIFVRAIDGAGNRVRDDRLRVVWTWQGRSPDQEARPPALDKGDSDFGHADIPIEKGVRAEIWLEGDGLESDHVANLHTDHNLTEKTSDGQDGNYWFHHSYLVIFQRQPVQIAAPPVQPDKPAQPDKPVQPDKPKETDTQKSAIPTLIPVPAGQFAIAAWPTSSRDFTQYFGEHPEWYLPHNMAGHEGIDLAAKTGDPVYAVADGDVHMVHPAPTGHNYGTHVRIDHAGGYQSIYAHLSALHVQEKQQVKAGQLIGLAGSTGNSTGPHLHFSLKKANADSPGYPGNFIDPLPFLLALAQSQPAGAPASSVAPTSPTPTSTASTTSAPAAEIAIPPDASWAARKAGEFWNKHGGYIASECQRLGIDPADAMGVIVTESGGEPFGPDGRMTIRFENHIFNSYWGKLNPQRFNDHFTFDANERWKGHTWRSSTSIAWQPCHGSQAVEWQVLDFARTLDNEAALKSISMGAGQIMGFNHETVGYPSAQAMFDAFSNDATAQIGAMFRFMEKNRLVESVRNKEYAAFARLYNGPGQAGEYATRMTDFANAFRSLGGAPAGRDAQTVTPTQPSVSAPADAEARAPMPDPVPGVPLKEADPELYKAWSKHIQSGFAQNEVMFGRVLNAFMNPYWATVWMYGLLFAVGIVTLAATIYLSLKGVNQPTTWLIAGMSVASFAAFFIRRPLQSLEENLQFITWLGIIYNTYWTTLVNAQDRNTFVADLDKATETAVTRIKELSETHAARSKERPKMEE